MLRMIAEQVLNHVLVAVAGVKRDLTIKWNIATRAFKMDKAPNDALPFRQFGRGSGPAAG
jgi:hypothetical protein